MGQIESSKIRPQVFTFETPVLIGRNINLLT